jgi:DNA polymerase elongation subunit (family B)
LSTRFFTSVEVFGNTIYHRFIENGERKQEKIQDFHPTVFVTSPNKDTKFTNLWGHPVAPKHFDDITSARNFIKQMSDVDGSQINGTTDWALQFTSNQYFDDIKYDTSKIRKFYVDIECIQKPELGFPVPEKAEAPIQLITVFDSITSKYYVFGEKPYTSKRADVLYMCEPDEKNRLIKFISFWERMNPDIVTGWNSTPFDMVYVYTRLINLLGEEFAKRLSPWRRVSYMNLDSKDREIEIDIAGISQLDYLDLYKKYVPGGKESYSLDFISELELDENKVDYSEYGSLFGLYENNWELFVDYNIRDVELVVRLDKKLKMIDIQVLLAYTGKVNYREVFSPLKLWTAIVYNHLIKTDVVIPPQQHHSKDTQFTGAFVFPPVKGLHDWVVSFDFTSLYPTVMASFNISPETRIQNPADVPAMLLEVWGRDISEDMLQSGAIPPEITQCLKDNNLIMTGNGQLYRTDIDGVLPILIRKMFAERKATKGRMLQLLAEYEKDKSQTHLKSEADALYCKEQALKIALNSLYGAVGAQYFILFDMKNAEAVTLTGQGFIKNCAQNISAYLSKVTGVSKDYIAAGDTDSIYVDFGPLVEKYIKGEVLDKLVDVVDTKFAEQVASYVANLTTKLNVQQSMMGLKREKVISRVCFVAKKAYYGYCLDSEGVRYAEPKMFDIGVESRRSSTPKWAREALKDCYKIILAKTPDDLYEYTRKLRLEFDKWEMLKISIPRGVSDIDKWIDSNGNFISRIPQHTRAAGVYNRHIKRLNIEHKYRPVVNGDKIRFIYLDPKNPLREDVCGFGEDGLPTEFDIEKYIDKDRHFDAFFNPLTRACEAANWSSTKQRNVEDFF